MVCCMEPKVCAVSDGFECSLPTIPAGLDPRLPMRADDDRLLPRPQHGKIPSSPNTADVLLLAARTLNTTGQSQVIILSLR